MRFFAGRGDNQALPARLAAGDDRELRIYPKPPHGFTGHPAALARTAPRSINSRLIERIAEP